MKKLLEITIGWFKCKYGVEIAKSQGELDPWNRYCSKGYERCLGDRCPSYEGPKLREKR